MKNKIVYLGLAAALYLGNPTAINADSDFYPSVPNFDRLIAAYQDAWGNVLIWHGRKLCDVDRQEIIDAYRLYSYIHKFSLMVREQEKQAGKRLEEKPEALREIPCIGLLENITIGLAQQFGKYEPQDWDHLMERGFVK